MKIIVARSESTEAQLADARFRHQWERLSHECVWGTAFQSVGFVATWYNCYGETHEPVIAYAKDDDTDTRLRGLLTLAIERTTNRWCVASAPPCEYEAWLEPEPHAQAGAALIGSFDMLPHSEADSHAVRAALSRIVHEASELPGVQSLYAAIAPYQTRHISTLEAIGFQLVDDAALEH